MFMTSRESAIVVSFHRGSSLACLLMPDDVGRESARNPLRVNLKWTEHISTSNQARSGPNSAFFGLLCLFSGKYLLLSGRGYLYVGLCVAVNTTLSGIRN